MMANAKTLEIDGLGEEFDPIWYLTAEQLELQEKLVELCKTTLRPNAIKFDANLEYPRENMEALASLGLLALHVPEKYGGMAQNHVCIAMVLESIGRHGCGSTALVYSMHLLATSALLLRGEGNEEIESVLRRLNKDVFIGTSSYSDPETGSHFWYPMASRSEKVDDGWKVSKKSSWTTSGGFADFYVAQTTSPDFGGDFSDLSVFLVYKDEIVSHESTWNAMGMKGNQSGPIEINDVVIPTNRMVGPPGDGAFSNDEAVDPIGILMFAATYNGISMGAMDIARTQVTRKVHKDVGMRVCDYPTIQDYFGDCIMDTEASRIYTYAIADIMDKNTNNCDWSLHAKDPEAMPRAKYLMWVWMTKFLACKNVYNVVDKMLQACGGSGYKTDLGLERMVRDGKAGWVMGPTNEVLRQFVGKWALQGFESLDYWNQNVNENVMNNEIKKLDDKQKKALIDKLTAELG
jgi:alkylation response protein AidB-like acyl-CoA dehydrogenase